MLRVLSAAALLLAAASVCATSSIAQAPITQTDMERPGGTYVSLPAADAQACAAQCARDGLCLAWTYTPQTCALKAVVTPAAPKQGAVSGLAPRAPQFAALVGHKEPLSPIPAPLMAAPMLAPPQIAVVAFAAPPMARDTNLATPDALNRLVPAPPQKVVAGPPSGPSALGYTWTAAASSSLTNAKAPTAAAPIAPPVSTKLAWLEPRRPLDISPIDDVRSRTPAPAPTAMPTSAPQPEEELLGGPEEAP